VAILELIKENYKHTLDKMANANKLT